MISFNGGTTRGRAAGTADVASGGPGRKPVVFFDRNGAFRVLRGYAADIISTSIKGHDRYLQFADSVEDIWNRAVWLIDQGAANPA